MHLCHADGCQADDCHPELPFCKRHFNMLPEGTRKRLWAGRRKDGLCGACHLGEADEVPLRAAKDWFELFNRSVAVLLVLEYDECGGHPQLLDSDGFCWGCGVADAEKTYQEAQKDVRTATQSRS